jgi:hypothetical protein
MRYFQVIFPGKVFKWIRAKSHEDALEKAIQKALIFSFFINLETDLESAIVVGRNKIKFFQNGREVTPIDFRNNLSENKNVLFMRLLWQELQERKPLPKKWLPFIIFISRYN